MKSDWFKGISIIFLGVCLIISSLIIKKSIENILDMQISNTNSQQTVKNIMNLKEAAQYLGVNSKELKHAVETTSVGIPCVKLDNKYIFTRKGLDKWMEDLDIFIDLDI
jgi:galactitol-specific phosphotransferase system IIB component